MTDGSDTVIWVDSVVLHKKNLKWNLVYGSGDDSENTSRAEQTRTGDILV